MSQNHPPATDDSKLKKQQDPASSQDEEQDQDPELNRRYWFFNVMPSWMVSFFTHIALIIFLAIWLMPRFQEDTISLEAGDQVAEALDSPDIDLNEMDAEETDPFESEMSEEPPEQSLNEPEPITLDQELFDQGDVFAQETLFDTGELGELSNSDMANETSSRSSSNKKSLLRKFGGNAASEKSVAMALKWIADHQLPDGGWNFDHRIGPGNFRTSPNPGLMTEARNGATAMALLPFLGNGQTHVTGEYKETVKNGLEFLMRSAKRKYRGLSYHEPGGSMYSHGLVAIVFCEAFAMTHDEQLAKYAQGTVWFIEDSQDPYGGGWRYAPKQRGDTSAVGWQLMALKSGKMGGLNIDKKTYSLASKFLDNVSINSGAFYGYDDPPRNLTRGALARTSIGLLCRMYMGWDKNTPALVDGVQWIDENGPSTGPTTNMYYNYYGTQLMKHYGGGEWTKWNEKMRDYLVKTQATKGPSKGSWMFSPRSLGSERGGRLYNTSMACMTLEVYYRYLPLYDDNSVADEFPLD